MNKFLNKLTDIELKQLLDSPELIKTELERRNNVERIADGSCFLVVFLDEGVYERMYLYKVLSHDEESDVMKVEYCLMQIDLYHNHCTNMDDAQLRQQLNDATISFKLEHHTFDYVKRVMEGIHEERHNKWQYDTNYLVKYLEHINTERL